MRAEGTEVRTRSGSSGDPGRAFLYASGPAAGPALPAARNPTPDVARTPPRTAPSGRQQDRSSVGERKPSAARALSLTPSGGGSAGGGWGPRSATSQAASPAVSASPAKAATMDRWAQAMENMQDARQAANVLVRTVDEAIYMDEDSYSQVAGVHQYMRTIQAQQSRVRDLSAEVQRLQSELSAEQAVRTDAERLIQEKNAELENNSVVFKMHYEELLARDEAIRKLQTVISGLT